MSSGDETDIRYTPNVLETIDTLQLHKLEISQKDISKIHALGLSEEHNKLLIQIYYYLNVLGMYHDKNILMMSMDILANIIHPKSSINIQELEKNVSTYSACIDSLSYSSRNNLKDNIIHNINVLHNMKQVISTLQTNTTIKLSDFESLFKQRCVKHTMPPLEGKDITFNMYLSYVNYSLHDTTTVDNQQIDLTNVYVKCVDIIDTNINRLQELLALDNDELIQTLLKLKQLHVKPLQVYIDASSKHTSELFHKQVSTKYIVDIFESQLLHFLFNIPLYSYNNMYEIQLNLQKRLKAFLQTIHHLCIISPFIIKLDIHLPIINKTYTFDIHLGDILNILDCKRSQSIFSFQLFFQLIVSSEINEYITEKDSSGPSLSQIIQNLLYELGIYIYNYLIPEFNTLMNSDHILLNGSPNVQTVLSFKDVLTHKICTQPSNILSNLINILQPPLYIPNAIQHMFTKKKINMETMVTNPDILLFNIHSFKDISFIHLLDFFIGLCTTGTIQSFGTLHKDISFDELITMYSKQHRVYELHYRHPLPRLDTQLYTVYYLESVCVTDIIHHIRQNKPIISKDIIKIDFIQ